MAARSLSTAVADIEAVLKDTAASPQSSIPDEDERSAG